MKLTAELISASLSYLNPLKERELDLRGHKIPFIENLGDAKDADAIDFTDNAIPSLSNIPLFPRLHSLYLARNRVNHIAPNLHKQVPNLHTLILTENSFAELADIEPLRLCKKLTHLSLLENPLTARENYRLWVIWLAPQVRFLDFAKVKDAEREQAKELFGQSFEEPTDAAKKVLSVRVGKPLVPGQAGANGSAHKQGLRIKLTLEERAMVEQKVRDAKSLKEIEALEKLLREGKVPG